uniref:Probable membrane transporter protein n=1 Tax=uncultured Armatimonadetes bacterium TaxID=157466 RepID=A0A6J4HKX9_9BACT|nr:hypothetical protein AVDCRST_MAG63-747 [uncultured Armatimonadetes bacterium]
MDDKAIPLLLLGLLAGVLGGMFGIGGGLVMVPGMVLLLHYPDKKAVGTSLATILLPVGILGVIEHWRAGNVDVRVAALLGGGFVVGSLVGARFINQPFIDKQTFKALYAVFLLAIAAKYLWDVFGSKK